MAIRPISFNSDGSVEVYHDEGNHGGTVQVADIHYAKAPDGTEDERFLLLACPVAGCSSVSLHPIGGGCDPENVQRLHAHIRKVKAPTRKWADVTAEVRTKADQMDGPGRGRVK